jgi:hypothetical protein
VLHTAGEAFARCSTTQAVPASQAAAAATAHLLSTQDQCLLWQVRGFLVM